MSAPLDHPSRWRRRDESADPLAGPPAGRTSPFPSGMVCLATKRADLVEVSCSGVVLGYVEVVGGLFVVLAGSRQDTAVEVLQTPVFERALGALAVA